MNEVKIPFSALPVDNLALDCVYESGPTSQQDSEVLSKLLPKCPNAGGFRWALRRDASGKKVDIPAYIVLYTSMEELAWPDYLDVESGVFHYYGDNRTAGKALHETKGNRRLNQIFTMLHNGDWSNIPPILVFRKTGERRNVRFLGLAAPGNPKLSKDQDLVAFWRTIGSVRFQNYEAYFTILDTKDDLISVEWLKALITDHANSLAYAPATWKQFVLHGREGIQALKAPKLSHIPSPAEQMPHSEEGRNLVNAIYSYYKTTNNFYGFEGCAAEILTRMDPHFEDITLTRPWRDGGRDALAYYRIGNNLNLNTPLKIDCAIEAKCFPPTSRVGVKYMSRLISRIRYRQFGVMVTTACVDKQAYSEVVEDGHPILILTGADIAHILHKSGITSENINSWLPTIESKYPRLG